MLTRLQRSISAKLILLFICAGAVLLLLVGSILGKGFSQHFRSSIEPFMVHYIALMQQELGSPPEYEKATRITVDIPVDIHVFGPDDNWTTGKQILDRGNLSDTSENPEESTLLVSQFQLQGSERKFKLKRIGETLILQTLDGDHEIYFEIHDKRGIRHGGQFSVIILLSIFGILILIYLATRSIFSPIQDIKTGVSEFGKGRLDHRIYKRRNDELGELTDSVNKMASDIDNMLEAKRQMLLGISHELRSPLTRCRINLALMEDSDPKSAIDDEITLMDQLITELLESERLNSPHKVIRPELLNVADLINDVLATDFAGNTVRSEITSIDANVDPIRIKLLVRNLIQNAIRYNDYSQSDPVAILSREKDGFSISVEDFGTGISNELIPFLTEPFYRADPSRQRQTGGYGLGLYLCRIITEAHGGKIQITSTVGKGTRIKCRFPETINTS